jgi:malate dehydrogenase (oxaloacetate-decarboxylating)
MNSMKAWFAEHTNEKRVRGTIADALKGADVFVGLSGPGVVSAKDIRRMAKNPVVFAMANPVPEVMPEEVRDIVTVMATGRSDYPNQINNVLGFPGFFRGLLDVRARTVNDEMKIAAAQGIASIITSAELGEEYIIPSVFDKRVVEAVASGVARAAVQTGVARRKTAGARTSER